MERLVRQSCFLVASLLLGGTLLVTQAAGQNSNSSQPSQSNIMLGGPAGGPHKTFRKGNGLAGKKGALIGAGAGAAGGYGTYQNRKSQKHTRKKRIGIGTAIGAGAGAKMGGRRRYKVKH